MNIFISIVFFVGIVTSYFLQYVQERDDPTTLNKKQLFWIFWGLWFGGFLVLLGIIIS